MLGTVYLIVGYGQRGCRDGFMEWDAPNPGEWVLVLSDYNVSVVTDGDVGCVKNGSTSVVA